jgi:Spy/CpxP family protein refolding chaperone
MAASLWADAPLKGALGLSMDQAKQVQEIQAKYQRPYQLKRDELAKQMRKVRTARATNNRPALEATEPVARRLHGEMLAIQTQEDGEIRQLLTPEQSAKFDAWLKQRREMLGAKRDDQEFTGR